MMQPDTDGMVKVNAFVNRFKPYVGVGYTGDLGKTHRWKLDVDCGVMMWGGTPSLIVHDGVNLSKDIVNIKGKPGDYVDMMKAFKVYPVVSVSVSYRFFLQHFLTPGHGCKRICRQCAACAPLRGQ